MQVVRDLIPLGLENASSLLLAGSSAGGTGVMLNLDHVHNLVHHELGEPAFHSSVRPSLRNTFLKQFYLSTILDSNKCSTLYSN